MLGFLAQPDPVHTRIDASPCHLRWLVHTTKTDSESAAPASAPPLRVYPLRYCARLVLSNMARVIAFVDHSAGNPSPHAGVCNMFMRFPGLHMVSTRFKKVAREPDRPK